VIDVEDLDGVRVVRMEHGKVNALDLEMLQELTASLSRLTDACAIVLTGAGRAFSAGVNLRRILDDGPDYVAAFLPALSQMFLTVFDHPRPVVAAVNGHAIAGGCISALACDHRLMSAGTIGVTELLVGLPFPPAAVETLRFALGPAATSLVLSGRTLAPTDALTTGLVDEVTEPERLLPEAVRRAGALARIPAETFTLTKRQLRREARQRIAAAAVDDDQRLVDIWSSEVSRRAITGYLEQLARRPRG
jgi:enoyl-CoA hydratase